MDPQDLMQLAIDAVRQGVAEGQSPFGCAIARDGEVIAVAHNQVLVDTDITAHAEVTALRIAGKNTGEILLPGAIVATTCEPCPMCMAALHWARVQTVYHGATIADADAAGFNELHLPANELLRIGQSDVELVAGVLADECKQLFAEWKDAPGAQAY